MLLCSCIASHRDSVHFIHAIGITEGKDGEFQLVAVAEKQGTKDGDGKYFTADAKGKTVGGAIEEMNKKYSGCYFASCEIFVIPCDADMDFTSEISVICENALMPSTAFLVCADKSDLPNIFDKVKDEDDITKLISKAKKHSPVFVRFVSDRLSKKDVTVPVICADGDGKISLSRHAVFSDSSVTHRKEKSL